MTAWTQRVRILVKAADRIQAGKERIASDLQAKELEIASLSFKIERTTKVCELLRALMDLLVMGQVKSIESIVTQGLSAVFFDQILAFEATVAQRYGKIAIDFLLRQGEDTPYAIRGEPLESFGGGPSCLASLIIRLLALLRLKRAPLLALDETLSPVSDEYIDQTSKFLRELSKSTGVDFLLVTQKRAYLDYADTSYECSEGIGVEGSRHLEICKVKTKG